MMENNRRKWEQKGNRGDQRRQEEETRERKGLKGEENRDKELTSVRDS